MSWFAKRRLRRSTSTFRGTCTEAVTLGSVEYGGKGCWLGSCGKYCVLSCTRAIGVHGLPVSPSCILQQQLPFCLKLQFAGVGARGRGRNLQEKELILHGGLRSRWLVTVSICRAPACPIGPIALWLSGGLRRRRRRLIASLWQELKLASCRHERTATEH